MTATPTPPSNVEPVSTADPSWDLVIKPRNSSLSLEISDIWRYKDLLYLFTRRDIVAFYKQTLLGPLWFFIQPVFTTIVYVIVFGQIANLSTEGAPQILFYLSGITLWNYFSECLNKTSTTFRDNSQLFGKVYFPRLIVPISIILSSLFKLLIQFALFFIVFLWYFISGKINPNYAILWLPVTILTLAILSLGFGLLLSALTTKYRDMIYVLQFGIQLLMYATPIIYPSSQIPASISGYIAANPLSPLIEITRYGFLGTGEHNVLGIIYALTFASILFIVSLVIFNRVERTFLDTV